jgi:hypothetical protein
VKVVEREVAHGRGSEPGQREQRRKRLIADRLAREREEREGAQREKRGLRADERARVRRERVERREQGEGRREVVPEERDVAFEGREEEPAVRRRPDGLVDDGEIVCPSLECVVAARRRRADQERKGRGEERERVQSPKKAGGSTQERNLVGGNPRARCERQRGGQPPGLAERRLGEAEGAPEPASPSRNAPST